MTKVTRTCYTCTRFVINDPDDPRCKQCNSDDDWATRSGWEAKQGSK